MRSLSGTRPWRLWCSSSPKLADGGQSAGRGSSNACGPLAASLRRYSSQTQPVRRADRDGGRQELWIEGSFGREMDVQVNGRRVGKLGGSINGRITAELVATLDLPAGIHVVTLTQGGGSLAPGNGGDNRLLGPVALVPVEPDSMRVKRLPAARWRELCRTGRQIDWVEAVRPAT